MVETVASAFYCAEPYGICSMCACHRYRTKVSLISSLTRVVSAQLPWCDQDTDCMV